MIGDDWAGRAEISPCGKYRYLLERAAPMNDGRFVLWIMLNPSTADAVKNDATIRRCISYTAAWGFGKLRVVNLYAYRSSSPAALRAFYFDRIGVNGEDGQLEAIGPLNDASIALQFVEGPALVVCAWGSPGPHDSRPYQVLRIARNARASLHFLRMNQSTNASLTCWPSHPLRLPKDLRPQRWDILDDRGPGVGG